MRMHGCLRRPRYVALRRPKASAFAVNKGRHGFGSNPIPEGAAGEVASLRPKPTRSSIAHVGKSYKELASVTDSIDRD
jgi:hypothetical protein